MDDATQKVIDQIEKLMRVAAKTPNEAEAASFTAKANALLARHNLTISEVETASSGSISGRRLDEQVSGSGGMYKYQQKLWRNIAALNFCMYWSMVIRVRDGGSYVKQGRVVTRQFKYGHRLVGRQVNVIATKNLAAYLNGVIERMCRERLQDRTDDIVGSNNQFFSRWAVAFREGVADRVVDKIRERRDTVLQAEERRVKAAARAAARAGQSVSTALTLAAVKDREHAANYDFLHGEGAWAEKLKREAEWEAEEAKEAADAEKQYAAWALAHPEEAAAEERKARARERARDRRAARGGSWGRFSFRSSPEDLRRESGGYHAGWDAGEKVSIDQQVDTGARKMLSNG